MARIGSLFAFAGMVIAFIIGVGIALVVLDARESNDIVSGWLDVARFFTEPFQGIFDLERGKEHLQTAINWGIAALAYWLAGMLIARVIAAASGRALARRREAY